MRAVELLGVHVEATSNTPLVLLREHDEPHRVLPIFIGPPEATAIALALAEEETPRPMTHDLMATLLETLAARLDAVEVTEVRDGTFFAQLQLHGPAGAEQVDSRPSDGIALAVRLGAPLFVDDAVLAEAGTTIRQDEEEIDEAVERFRRDLDDVSPEDFARDEPGSEPPDADDRP